MKKDSKNDFSEILKRLVFACESMNDSEIHVCKNLFAQSEKQLRVKVSEYLEWEESLSEGYEECPLVTQTFGVYLGEDLLYEGQRMFGSELVDQTHTGLGGSWEVIQVDMGDDDAVIEALKELGQEIEWPDVPEWR